MTEPHTRRAIPIHNLDIFGEKIIADLTRLTQDTAKTYRTIIVPNGALYDVEEIEGGAFQSAVICSRDTPLNNGDLLVTKAGLHMVFDVSCQEPESGINPEKYLTYTFKMVRSIPCSDIGHNGQREDPITANDWTPRRADPLIMSATP